MSKPLTIVVLDDDARVLNAFRRGLSARGVEVIVCSNVEDAERALNPKPDLVLVDLMLEGGGGDHLSNSFIENHLVPQGIRYARVTSAPGLVPPHLVGEFPIFDKNDWDTEFDDYCDDICRCLSDDAVS
jgi:hypothetical protein